MPSKQKRSPDTCKKMNVNGSSSTSSSRWSAASIEELSALLQREEQVGYGTTESVSCLALNGEEACVALNLRRQICDWYYTFVDHYNFDREVVTVALNYYDRYMLFQQTTMGELPQGDRVHLVALSAMFLAIKIHSVSEEHLLETRAKALGNLYYCHFDKKQVATMEMEILKTLDWKLNPPTMHQFAINLAHLHPLGEHCARSTSYLYEVARYLAELVVFFPTLLARFKPSVLAYAAILNGSENLPPGIMTADVEEKWISLMSHPDVNMDPSDVKEAMAALDDICPQLPDMLRIESLREGQSQSSERQDIRTPTRAVTPTNVTQF